MDCQEIRDILPRWRAGKLDEAAGARVREHLDACPGCREFERDEAEIRRAFEATRPEGAPLDLRALAGARRRPARRLRRIAAAALALAAVALFLAFVRVDVRRFPDGIQVSFSGRGSGGPRAAAPVDVDRAVAVALSSREAARREELKDLAVVVREALREEFQGEMARLAGYIRAVDDRAGEGIFRNREIVRQLGGIVLAGHKVPEASLEEQ